MKVEQVGEVPANAVHVFMNGVLHLASQQWGWELHRFTDSLDIGPVRPRLDEAWCRERHAFWARIGSSAGVLPSDSALPSEARLRNHVQDRPVVVWTSGSPDEVWMAAWVRTLFPHAVHGRVDRMSLSIRPVDPERNAAERALWEAGTATTSQPLMSLEVQDAELAGAARSVLEWIPGEGLAIWEHRLLERVNSDGSHRGIQAIGRLLTDTATGDVVLLHLIETFLERGLVIEAEGSLVLTAAGVEALRGGPVPAATLQVGRWGGSKPR